MHFADRLCEKIKGKKTPLCVGIDPRLNQLPKEILESVDSTNHESIARAFRDFGFAIIDQVRDLVPIVKPQIAFFEQYGWQGFRALSEIVQHAREKGVLVVMDAKRGDIGSTAEAYASAFLDSNSGSEFSSDALTVNPYLGHDSMEPFLDVASNNGSGIFVLVKTSNKGGKQFQDLSINDGANHEKLFERVADYVEAKSLETKGDSGYGICGAVVGATYPAELDQLRKRMPHTFFLIPGFGAQGGKASELTGGFDKNGLGAIVNSSRQIIFAYNREQYSGQKDWKAAIRNATLQSIEEIRVNTSAGNL